MPVQSNLISDLDSIGLSDRSALQRFGTGSYTFNVHRNGLIPIRNQTPLIQSHYNVVKTAGLKIQAIFKIQRVIVQKLGHRNAIGQLRPDREQIAIHPVTAGAVKRIPLQTHCLTRGFFGQPQTCPGKAGRTKPGFILCNKSSRPVCPRRLTDLIDVLHCRINRPDYRTENRKQQQSDNNIE